jgi:uncharacterized membrane protein (UPF0127 family)
MKSVLGIFVLAILGVIVFSLVHKQQLYRFPIHIEENEILVVVADTEIERQRGLSGTAPLESDQGMLFVFDEPGLHGFWMKEMQYSIDIIWFDTEKKIIHLESSVQPSSYPQIFVSETLAQYVLEVPAGFVSKNLVTIGDFAIWDFN